MFLWLKKPVTSHKTPWPGYRGAPKNADLERACPSLFVASYSCAMTTTWGDYDAFSTEKTRHNSQNSIFRIQERPPKRGFGAYVPFALFFVLFVCNYNNLRYDDVFWTKKTRHNSQNSIVRIQGDDKIPDSKYSMNAWFGHFVTLYLCAMTTIWGDDDVF